MLRPGGRLVLYDILAGPGGEVRFPVPWARQPATSFLVSPAELRALLDGSRFQIAVWRDATVAGQAFFAEQVAAAGAGEPPALGIHLLLGPDALEMFANLLRSLEEDRIRLLQVIARAI